MSLCDRLFKGSLFFDWRCFQGLSFLSKLTLKVIVVLEISVNRLSFLLKAYFILMYSISGLSQDSPQRCWQILWCEKYFFEYACSDIMFLVRCKGFAMFCFVLSIPAVLKRHIKHSPQRLGWRGRGRTTMLKKGNRCKMIWELFQFVQRFLWSCPRCWWLEMKDALWGDFFKGLEYPKKRFWLHVCSVWLVSTKQHFFTHEVRKVRFDCEKHMQNAMEVMLPRAVCCSLWVCLVFCIFGLFSYNCCFVSKQICNETSRNLFD